MDERRLRIATIVTGGLVLAYHGLTPLACAIIPGAPVEKRAIEVPLGRGHQPVLELHSASGPTASTAGTSTARTSTGAAPDLSAALASDHARIERGTVVELRYEEAPGESPRVVEAAFAALDVEKGRVLLSHDGERLVYVPIDQIRRVTVLGETPSGYVGTGMLVGGLSMATLSLIAAGTLAATTDDGISRGIAVTCAAGIGSGLSLASMGIGAAIGQGMAEDHRPRQVLPIGGGQWRIGDTQIDGPVPGEPRLR